MKKRFKLGAIAIGIAGIIFMQSMPHNLLAVIAEGIAESLTIEETVERELYSGNLTDGENIGSS